MNHRAFTVSPIAWAIGLVVIGIGLRIARHFGVIDLPPNVSPVSALAMFSGTVLPRRYAFVVPLGLMLASDIVIGFYELPVMMAVYGCFALSNLIGFWLRHRRNIRRTIAAALAGSTVFFLITNAAVWIFQAMYPHTLAGLGQAYGAGLPFFRNTVAGDLSYTAVFFGLYHLIVVYSKQRIPLVSKSTIDG
ncbi:MAG: hypothetical protein HY975_00675 [Candidatus Kerfeldbacteria bacterium]|nr:hypothetical protein [Candidatus Kerfeldbacteria bacterium]